MMLLQADFAAASIIQIDRVEFDGQWLSEEPVYARADSPEGTETPFVHLDGSSPCPEQAALSTRACQMIMLLLLLSDVLEVCHWARRVC